MRQRGRDDVEPPGGAGFPAMPAPWHTGSRGNPDAGLNECVRPQAEELLVGPDRRFKMLHRLQILHVPDVLAEKGISVPRETERIFQFGAACKEFDARQRGASEGKGHLLSSGEWAGPQGRLLHSHRGPMGQTRHCHRIGRRSPGCERETRPQCPAGGPMPPHLFGLSVLLINFRSS